MWLTLLLAALLVPLVAATDDRYVTWLSHSGFENQRQTLEISLRVAECLGYTLAVHDWRSSVHSTHNASVPRPSQRRMRALRVTDPETLPFGLLLDEAHLARTASTVAWRHVPRDARVVQLHMSSFCHYTCGYVRREVARLCPRGMQCLTTLAPEDGGDEYGEVPRVNFNDAYAPAGELSADGMPYSDDATDDDAIVDAAQIENAAALFEGAREPLRLVAQTPAPRRALLVVPLIDWGSVEALFPSTAVSNAVRSNARVRALVDELRALLPRHYDAAHMRVGDLDPLALYSCSRAGALFNDSASSSSFARHTTPHGVACYSARRGYLRVEDVALLAPNSSATLFVATNEPLNAHVQRLRRDVEARSRTLLLLDDLLASASDALRERVRALELEAQDALVVRSLLEQELCARAPGHYVATGVSAWDQYVLRERAGTSVAGSKESVADYALYVRYVRAWLASYACTNESRPSSALASVLLFAITCVAAAQLRAAYTLLASLEDEARRRAAILTNAFFMNVSLARSEGNISGRLRAARNVDGDVALARSLALARYLLLAHGFILLIVEPLTAAAQINRGSTLDVASALSWLRAMCIVALCALVTLEVALKGWRARLLVLALALAGGAGVHALTLRGGATSVSRLGSVAPAQALAALLAFAGVHSLLVAGVSALAARSERRQAARARTSLERAMRAPLVHAGALAVHAGSLMAALALRAAYVTPDFRVDSWLDVARTCAEVVCACTSAHVLVGNGVQETRTVLLPTAPGAGGVTDDDADDDGEPFDRVAAERKSDQELAAAYEANTRLKTRLESASLI